MLHRTALFSAVALCAVMVTFGLAGDNKEAQGQHSKFVEHLRADQELDMAMPAESARLLTQLITNHCKSDKVTVTVKKEENGLATLTIRGEVAHIATVAKFTLLLKGELLTAEEELAQSLDAVKRAMNVSVPPQGK
jgi:hypothetical protein